MRPPQNPVEEQIEAGFDFRGDVTVRLKDGAAVEGFLFNRDFAPHPRAGAAPFVELYLPDGEKRTLTIESIDAVELSGEDHAVPFHPAPDHAPPGHATPDPGSQAAR